MQPEGTRRSVRSQTQRIERTVQSIKKEVTLCRSASPEGTRSRSVRTHTRRIRRTVQSIEKEVTLSRGTRSEGTRSRSVRTHTQRIRHTLQSIKKEVTLSRGTSPSKVPGENRSMRIVRSIKREDTLSRGRSPSQVPLKKTQQAQLQPSPRGPPTQLPLACPPGSQASQTLLQTQLPPVLALHQT